MFRISSAKIRTILSWPTAKWSMRLASPVAQAPLCSASRSLFDSIESRLELRLEKIQQFNKKFNTGSLN
ncbi:hypothetical protein M5D96_002139 [Drosophila gunungcola]|uniref:Uncharacterized protein n=1 Tax=Drosophila gunungcola TaxID=103775 RepID=A0A9P9YZD0_9MUSC|nr:hypothetical protein M5D96_002139 [Drosophila gunungcola]